MRMPQITEKVLNGLNAALCHYEADDHTDTDEDELEEVRAASAWLTNAFAVMEERIRKKRNIVS